MTEPTLFPLGNQAIEEDLDPEGDFPELPVRNGSAIPTHGGAYTLYNVQGIRFEVTRRYEYIRQLGRTMGVFRDTITNTLVAIKKIPDAFQNVIQARRVLREIVIQKDMDHANVVKLLNVILPPNPRRFRDVYIVLEFMPSNLGDVIAIGPAAQGLDHRHFKYILFQLFQGLQYIHRMHAWHRNIKPTNVLSDERCNVKITEFGLSCTMPGFMEDLTEGIVVNNYRAPEVVLGSSIYDGGDDVWAVGCIFMELVLGRPLFRNEGNHLAQIFQLVGTPAVEDLDWLEELTRVNILNMRPIYPRRNFQNLLPGEHYREAARLMNRIFVFHPNERITADEALRHPYFEEGIEGIQHDVGLRQVQENDTPFIRQIVYDLATQFSLRNNNN